MAKVKDEKNEKELRLNKAIAQIQKTYGVNALYRLSDGDIKEVPRVTTGSLLFDEALGGGFATGRMHELFGEESSGKTHICLCVAKTTTDKGLPVFWLDAEGTLTEEHVRNFGINTSLFFKINNAVETEKSLDIIRKILEDKVPCLIVIDSIPALVPDSEVEHDMSAVNVGGNSKLVSKAVKLFQVALNLNKEIPKELEENAISGIEVENMEATILLINQVRDSIGSAYVTLKTTGGRALKHYMSTRTQVRRVEWIEEGTDKNKIKTGQVIGVKIVKNKTFPPYREAQFTIMFPPKDCLPDMFFELTSIGVKKGIIERGGSWMTFGDTKIQGFDNLVEEFRKNPELFENLKCQLRPLGVKV